MQLIEETITPEMSEIKLMIAQTVIQRNQLKVEMEQWYDRYPRQHFPKMKNLMLIDSTLSNLDSLYKNLWDFNNADAYAKQA